MLLQVGAGFWLFNEGFEPPSIHMFYGFLGLAAVAVIVSYRHLASYRYLIYGIGGLFVMGLAIRAATLDPVPG